MISNKRLNQIVHCDCIEGIGALPDACIPLTVTSPPYDAMRDYGGTKFQFEPIATELARVTMPGGVIVWVVQDQIVDGFESGTSARQRLFFETVGMNVHGTVIMAMKGCRYPRKQRYGQQFHYAFVLSKGKPRVVKVLQDKPNSAVGAVVANSRRFRNGDLTTTMKPKRIGPYGLRGNVWLIDAGNGRTTKDRFAYEHPALMPEGMAEDHILSWSQPGDLVFDPMCGAATTCKMALLNHRKYLGMEVHQPYWELACKRMELAKEAHQRQVLAILRQKAAG
ncbi:MAG: site-specific DNA-methyltransferase [Gemmataceae bacterium]|nr:site-specific DNA-methyltransferase [Gemmataceae bacterium]